MYSNYVVMVEYILHIKCLLKRRGDGGISYVILSVPDQDSKRSSKHW